MLGVLKIVRTFGAQEPVALLPDIICNSYDDNNLRQEPLLYSGKEL